MIPHSRTKVVCTIGPASSDPAVLRALVDAGMNVARINFSHGTHAQHATVIAAIRRIGEEAGRPIAILGDLQGPRIRIGDLAAPINVAPGDERVFVPEVHARPGDIPVTYDDIGHDVRPGGRILVNDGLLEFDVVAVDGDRVTVRTVHGGAILSHKGMNLPGTDVSAPSLTEKDRADIAFAVEQGVSYLALSFVRRAEDIEGLRRLVPKGMLLVAKIEKDTALEHLPAIVQADCRGGLAGGAQRVGLRLATPLGHRLSEVGEQDREPEPEIDLERKAQPSMAHRQVAHKQDRGQGHHDLDREHHGVLHHRARVQFPHGGDGGLEDDLAFEQGMFFRRHERCPL